MPAISPTSYEIGVLNGQVRPGDTSPILSGGLIGLAATGKHVQGQVGTARGIDPHDDVGVGSQLRVGDLSQLGSPGPW